MFRAVFLTQSPLVAAFYAGNGGIVHGFMISGAARLLDVTEETGSPAMTPVDLMALDKICLRQRDGGFLRMAGDLGFTRGTSSWDLSLLILGTVPELGDLALRELGYDGFVRQEWTRWAYGDRPKHAIPSGARFDTVLDHVSQKPNVTHRVVGIRDPSVLCPFESHAPSALAEMAHSGRFERATELGSQCA